MNKHLLKEIVDEVKVSAEEAELDFILIGGTCNG